MEAQHEQIWNNCLDMIRDNIPQESYQTWFHPIQPLKLEDNQLTVQVPSKFFYEWIEGHYSDLLTQAMGQCVGPQNKLLYTFADNSDHAFKRSNDNLRKRFSKQTDEETQLNSRQTFENFIEGSSNQFAKAAALAVSEAPGATKFNPLLIYGGSGLGKTHLINAIGNFAKSHNTAKRIRYVTSEQFTIDFISSIQNHKTAELSGAYRAVDLLLVDDVQFFIDKERTQEEFFHTFNTLHQRGKQIILSSDRSPEELKGLEQRLVSRFQSGLVVDIHLPDLETRIAILQRKALEEGIELRPDIAEFIASNITSNVRELEGALIRLLAFASLRGKPLTLDLCREVLKHVTRNRPNNINIESIQRVVAQYFQIPEDLLSAKTRRKEAVHARMVSMFLTRSMTGNSLKRIGLLHGGKDHSTVIHAIRTVEKQAQGDPGFVETLETLQRKIELN
jgi:chromosomal replication initiator protein